MSSVTRRSAYQGGILVQGITTYRDAGVVSTGETTHSGLDVTHDTVDAINTGMDRSVYAAASLNNTCVAPSGGTYAYRVTINRVYN